MTQSATELEDMLGDLVLAHKILCREGVFDPFGHVSLRDPDNPETFWLPSALPPSRVRREHLLQFSMAGEPVHKADAPLYSERHIHSEIYRARPDVTAICHHHSPAIMPFCASDRKLAAVSQTGAFLGLAVPVWDSADEFGDTNMLVTNPQQAASLARALGAGWIVLLRCHGAVVGGRDINDLLFKTVFACRDAQTIRDAAILGEVKTLSPGEIALAGTPKDAAIRRAIAHWTAGDAEKGV